MPKKLNFSAKHLQISKANSTIVLTISITAFVVVFSIVACNYLIKKSRFLSKVSSEKKTSLETLKSNNANVKSLFESYTQFADQNVNVIGGNSKAVTPTARDGDNPKIVLDALPSKYDFPGLQSSIEKLLVDRNFTITSLTGTDDELAQAASQSTEIPVAVEIPFSIAVDGSYASVKELVSILENSVRPIKVKQLKLAGGDSKLTITISAVTYYQPAKSFTVGSKQIK